MNILSGKPMNTIMYGQLVLYQTLLCVCIGTAYCTEYTECLILYSVSVYIQYSLEYYPFDNRCVLILFALGCFPLDNPHVVRCVIGSTYPRVLCGSNSVKGLLWEFTAELTPLTLSRGLLLSTPPPTFAQYCVLTLCILYYDVQNLSVWAM